MREEDGPNGWQALCVAKSTPSWMPAPAAVKQTASRTSSSRFDNLLSVDPLYLSYLICPLYPLYP
jgi:hypothetical protein